MNARLTALAARCKKRGGDCPCRGKCEAAREAENQIGWLTGKRVELDRQIAGLQNLKRRLETPLATLREGFTFKPELTPVMVFDGEIACFGYEDGDEWIESDEWPFNETFVWPDDCERHGIRVET